MVVATMPDMMTDTGVVNPAVGSMPIPVILANLVSLALFIPGLALAVRRLHDKDKSGWWCLIGLVPFVGTNVLLVWFWSRGTDGENRFGPDPISHAD